MKNLERYYRDRVFRIVDYINDYHQNEECENIHSVACDELGYDGFSSGESLCENKKTQRPTCRDKPRNELRDKPRDNPNPINYDFEYAQPRRESYDYWSDESTTKSDSPTQNHNQCPRCCKILSSIYHLEYHTKWNCWESSDYYEENVKNVSSGSGIRSSYYVREVVNRARRKLVW